MLWHGLGTEAFCCCEDPTARIQLEKSCAFGVHAAMNGVDEPLAFVLVCCADLKDFPPRGSIFRYPHLVMALQELGTVLVDVNHVDKGLLGRQHSEGSRALRAVIYGAMQNLISYSLLGGTVL